MDHIRPLIESLGNIEFWRLSNLQTLCVKCHHAKTGREATARAESRRSIKNLDNEN
jgi:5-methylcytosine-specific restriction endonuclease McrA